MKNKFKIIGSVLLSIFIAFFSFIPFLGNHDIDCVYADSQSISSSFSSSNIATPVRGYFDPLNISYAPTYFVNFSFDINSSSVQNSFIINFDVKDLSFTNRNYLSHSFSILPQLFYSDNLFSSYSRVNFDLYDNDVLTFEFPLFVLFHYEGQIDAEPGVINSISSIWKNDIFKISLGNSLDNSLPNLVLENGLNCYFNFISYTCSTQTVYFCFPIFVGNSVSSITNLNRFFDNRTYYLNSENANNQIFTDGYSTGFAEGKNNGYNLGFNAGYSNGKDFGFNEGVISANDYSFLGLIGSIIDAPITAFRSLFNFEILGVNFASFVTGLFTLCVIIVVVKLCLGGK